MNYGASEHYQGERGQAYFASQNQMAEKEAAVTVWKFQPWIKPTDRVLDFGCAGGWILRNLDCAERVGVELNPEAHPVCRQNGVNVYSWLHEVEQSGFDVAISHHCLEHVPFPIEALKRLHSLLKDGGLMVLVVPIDDWRVEKDYTGEDIDHHLHTWTPRLMANTLVEAGFRVNRVDVLTHALFPGWSGWGRAIPRPVFDALCRVAATMKKRRQLLAIARKGSG
jgi:SAM-dependent methyltransferase